MNEFWSLITTALTVQLLPAVLMLVIGVLVVRLADKIVGVALEKTKLEKAAHSLIRNVVKVVLYAILALMIASKLGIDVTSVVALASVLTLAISLSLQNMLANVIGGFTILSTTPFHSGDYVEIAGQAGTVEKITMTYTKLLTVDQKVVSIPNSAVTAAQIINYSASETRRVDIDVNASYDTPVQSVIDALVNAGTMDNVLTDPAPFAAVTGYGESTISYTLRVYCKSADYWDVYFGVMQNVKKTFDEQNIAMSYPHLNVHLDK